MGQKGYSYPKRRVQNSGSRTTIQNCTRKNSDELAGFNRDQGTRRGPRWDNCTERGGTRDKTVNLTWRVRPWLIVFLENNKEDPQRLFSFWMNLQILDLFVAKSMHQLGLIIFVWLVCRDLLHIQRGRGKLPVTSKGHNKGCVYYWRRKRQDCCYVSNKSWRGHVSFWNDKWLGLQCSWHGFDRALINDR